MKLNKLILTVLAGSMLFVSCSDDDAASGMTGPFTNGILVLNQGGFGAGDAEVSFLSHNMELQNNIFSGMNGGAALGDTGQSIGIEGNNAYIVVNNSQKIEVVDRVYFRHVATITQGLNNPRYIAFDNNKAYVTNWGDGMSTTDDFVAVIDLATNAVTATIPVAEGPEKIVSENGKLYVAHYGGFGYGNTVTVIDSTTDTVETTINVGDVPNSLEVANGMLYVLSGGMPSWSGAETNGELHVINLSNNEVDHSVQFSQHGPSNLDIEGGNIYYTINSGVYKMDVTATALPAEPLFTTTDQGAYGVYSFAVSSGHIYLGDAGDYNSAGKVYVHDINGQLHHTFTVGVVPAGFYFN